jgi:hypothetical protein
MAERPSRATADGRSVVALKAQEFSRVGAADHRPIRMMRPAPKAKMLVP